MRKAQVSLYLVFIIVTVVVITITAIVAPFGATFTAQMYAAGQDVLHMGNESIQNISNEGIRSSWTNLTNDAFNAANTNIEVTTNMYRYGWIFVILIAGLVLFLSTRRLVEFGFGGFV